MENWQHIGEPAQRVLGHVLRQRLAKRTHSKNLITAIWRTSAEDRGAVTRNIRRYATATEKYHG